jgi:CheY-like chemotaxis protein
MEEALKILLVEDDLDDVEFLKEALNKNKVRHATEVITKGDEVIPHLVQSKGNPDIIVLDLNLPRMHGKEILRRLKSNEIYKEVPIIVLSTSSAALDTEFCLNEGAQRFITKPISKEGFDKLVREIVNIAQRK